MSKLNTPAIAGIEYHFYKVLPDNAMLWFFFSLISEIKVQSHKKKWTLTEFDVGAFVFTSWKHIVTGIDNSV